MPPITVVLAWGVVCSGTRHPPPPYLRPKSGFLNGPAKYHGAKGDPTSGPDRPGQLSFEHRSESSLATFLRRSSLAAPPVSDMTQSINKGFTALNLQALMAQSAIRGSQIPFPLPCRACTPRNHMRRQTYVACCVSQKVCFRSVHAVPTSFLNSFLRRSYPVLNGAQRPLVWATSRSVVAVPSLPQATVLSLSCLLSAWLLS